MYSPIVSLSSIVQYSRAILGMDKNLCTDTVGNSVTRMPNSSVYIHIDRRKRCISTLGLMYPTSYFKLKVKL